MIAITNAKIITMADKIIEKGSIIIEGSKIKNVGKNIEIYEVEEIIDANNKIVIPGMIDAHTHLGLDEEGLGWEGEDFNETSDPVTPHLRAIDGVNPHELGLAKAYQNGITTVMTGPGSANVIGGQVLVMKTKGNTVDEMVLKSPAGIKAAVGENPKDYYGKQDESPVTRMAVAALLREAFMNTQDYLTEKSVAKKEDESFNRDIRLESIAQVINKEIPLKIHAHRADDIMTALRIACEFDIDITIEHCTEGHKVVDELMATDVSVTLGPSMSAAVKVELKEVSFETPGILASAGVKVALVSDHPVMPIENLPIYAALAVKSGMDEIDALKAITINPAEILGLADRVGSIEVGKDADLVIFDGDPLDIKSNIEDVFINGEKVKD
ncbi:amidohydrolase [Selenihalanaerobacter shriftii]|uniref:Imidazolonepropionase n=1 Tax=Selenihalanaerobacter shriftii TaxID=142842 RepID=A0A1T4Q9K0_9FIRM|nr:amidohydrolase [Selenihalanaerobacter shriftii]SKA00409.1 Imidazolonepropionase [Selenihalanaerobacter shriftii]